MPTGTEEAHELSE